MRRNLTEIVFILDASGSMAPHVDDTIGGYNSLLKKQRNEEGDAIVSTVTFSDASTVLADRVDIKEIKDLTDKEYETSGCTALLDAIGGAIHHIRNVHKYIREEDRPEKTLFIINTDGYENASRHYSRARIKEMIESQKKLGWSFVFLGAEIDAESIASSYGIDRDNAVTFHQDSEGFTVAYDALETAVRAIRTDGSISKDWKEEAVRDFASRKRKNK